MLAVAPEDIVIDLVIEEEIAPKRNAKHALIREELISILIPFPLRRYEAELDRFPKSRITIKICNMEIMLKIITYLFIRFIQGKEYY